MNASGQIIHPIDSELMGFCNGTAWAWWGAMLSRLVPRLRHNKEGTDAIYELLLATKIKLGFWTPGGFEDDSPTGSGAIAKNYTALNPTIEIEATQCGTGEQNFK